MKSKDTPFLLFVQIAMKSKDLTRVRKSSNPSHRMATPTASDAASDTPSVAPTPAAAKVGHPSIAGFFKPISQLAGLKQAQSG